MNGDGVLTLPPVDDITYPVTLPQPLPLGDAKNITTYTTVNVSTHSCFDELYMHLSSPITFLWAWVGETLFGL